MNKTKLLAVAVGFLAAAGLTTAGNVYIGNDKVGTYDGNVTVTGTGDLRLPSNTTIDGTSGDGGSASCGNNAFASGSSGTGCLCFTGWEYDGVNGGEVPEGEDCTAVETDSGTGGDGGGTSTPANCDGVSTVGSGWTQDTSKTIFSTFPLPSGNWEKFTIPRNEYQAIKFTTNSSDKGKVSFDRHTHAHDTTKTIAITECPGDFSNTLPSSLCRRTSQATAVYFNTESPFSSWECALEPNRDYYLNIAYAKGTGNNLENTCTETKCGGIYAFYH